MNANEHLEPHRTMYDRSKYKVGLSFSQVLGFACLVVVMLAGIRFLNNAFWWNMMRAEMEAQKSFQTGDFQFNGFSFNKDWKKDLQTAAQLSPNNLMAASHYDWLHPNVFAVHIKEQKTFVNLGLASVYPGKGLTSFTFMHPDILKSTDEKGQTRAFYYGSSIMAPLFHRLADFYEDPDTNAGSPKKKGTAKAEKTPEGMETWNGRGMSFIVNPVENHRYLHYPYVIYFYLPLILIFVLGGYYGKYFYISFFYYLEIFLLFDYKRALFEVPFSSILTFFEINPSQNVSGIVAVVVALVFVVLGFIGIFSNKKDEIDRMYLSAWGKALIWFFLLLPLALRF